VGPLSLSLSPSKGERAPFGAGEEYSAVSPGFHDSVSARLQTQLTRVSRAVSKQALGTVLAWWWETVATRFGGQGFAACLSLSSLKVSSLASSSASGRVSMNARPNMAQSLGPNR
jgi:hypothetical protein